jgi:hypothetical protein
MDHSLINLGRVHAIFVVRELHFPLPAVPSLDGMLLGGRDPGGLLLRALRIRGASIYFVQKQQVIGHSRFLVEGRE